VATLRERDLRNGQVIRFQTREVSYLARTIYVDADEPSIRIKIGDNARRDLSGADARFF
jgi:hypothetical protein